MKDKEVKFEDVKSPYTLSRASDTICQSESVCDNLWTGVYTGSDERNVTGCLL